MRAALSQAKKGVGRTSPNPAVGAVLVVGGHIVARGHHERAGGPHAEIACLQKFGRRIPASATLYVTLEPCSTTGRTPPCADQIIKSGLQSIVIGALDANPRHGGRAIPELRNSGMTVRLGVLAEECLQLNEAFNKWVVTGRPFVTAKCGMSLDGRLTRPPDERQWITDASARRDAHKLRAQVDAILVGAETIRRDNPRLTVRGIGKIKQPWRVVLTRSGNLPRSARILSDRWAHRTLVYRRRSLAAVLDDLGRKDVTSVLLEGGGELLGQALDGGLVDKVQVYLGPVLTGGPVVAFAGRGADSTQTATHLTEVSYRRLGRNICMTGYPWLHRNSSSE